MYNFDYHKSLLVLIKNSLGSKFFQSLYFKINNRSRDILGKGNLSCAFYVSVILKILNLIDTCHTTVDGLEKDLIKNKWFLITRPQKGAIIIWSKKKGHRHIGFCIGKKAVSNISSKKSPQIHSLNFEGRKIDKIYFHKVLNHC